MTPHSAVIPSYKVRRCEHFALIAQRFALSSSFVGRRP